MEELLDVINRRYYDSPIWAWFLAVFITVCVLFALQFIKTFTVRRLTTFAERTKTEIDNLIADLIRRTNLFILLLISLFIGSLILSLPESAGKLIRSITIVAFLLQGAIWGNGLIELWVNRYIREKLVEDAAKATTITALGFISKLVLWSIILLLALDNLGFDITALVAGLGIGGVAVALAAQNILGDLFASMSIVLDKPFVIGDFIIVDEYLGTVEHIGLKTTRIRNLYGELIVFSNNDLLKSRIRNYKRMFERRVVFSIGVVYETPYEKLTAIPGMIREIIESQNFTRFDRAHFKEYGNFSLNFEVVYYVLSPDYNLYMDIQQAINLAIFKRFKEEGIEFAYPTQTIYVQRTDGLNKEAKWQVASKQEN
jgi:small-conductance mechanosensitive channel